MKKIAITSLIISIISLIMVAFLYAPKIKRNQSVNQADIYQQQIVELFPELQGAVYIDSAQYYSYNVGDLNPTYFYSTLNNIPIVGFFNKEWADDFGDRRYEYFSSQRKMCYRIHFGESKLRQRLRKNNSTEPTNEYKISEITTYKCDALEKYVSKKILGNDTLVELSYHDRENRYNRYYSLKKENEFASRLIRFDWDLNYGDHSLNTIRIASRHWKDFKVNIATEYDKNSDLLIPFFDGKTIGVKINYRNQEYKTTAIVSDTTNVSEVCNPNLHSNGFIKSECNFTLIAPFENCNLKLRVRQDKDPLIFIENEITQLMQCLNVW